MSEKNKKETLKAVFKDCNIEIPKEGLGKDLRFRLSVGRTVVFWASSRIGSLGYKSGIVKIPVVTVPRGAEYDLEDIDNKKIYSGKVE